MNHHKSVIMSYSRIIVKFLLAENSLVGDVLITSPLFLGFSNSACDWYQVVRDVFNNIWMFSSPSS